MDPAMALELSFLERCVPIREAIQKGDSEIRKFYSNSVLFLTGGSGFLGKQLIEKLLRSCSDVKKVYILMRTKKGIPSLDRLQEMLKDPAFDELRSLQPKFAQKIHPIEGDLVKPDLGISAQDTRLITDEVDIIIHNAATVRFDEPLKNAVLTNVRGTRDLLKLGKSCKKLKAFVHVSTAYSHATKSRIETPVREQFYEVGIAPNTMIDMAEVMDATRLDNICPGLIGDWPNTYTFTKALAEELVRTMSDDLPICVIRPAIVIASYREPRPGWIDVTNAYGPSGLVLGVGLGVVHVFFLNSEVDVEFVPVDLVNNAIIAAAWETNNRRIKGEMKDIRIYTIARAENGPKYEFVNRTMSSDAIRGIVSPLTVWYAFALCTCNLYWYTALSWIFHYIPAYIFDGIRKLTGKRPKYVKLFTKIYAMSSVFFYFMNNNWKFDDSNSENLFLSMNETDRTIYDFDRRKINWTEYMVIWCIGIRKYILKDGLKGTEMAVRKQKFLRVANYTVLTLYGFAIWKVFSFVLSIFGLLFF